jgi:hypothetical protein
MIIVAHAGCTRSGHTRGNAKEAEMVEERDLCNKIKEIYPDIGECGIDLDVAYDSTQERWTVNLKKDANQLKTYLEPGDAELCLTGRQCIRLSIEIAQLRGNIERMRE